MQTGQTYNYMNIHHYFRELGIDNADYFRWVKDIMGIATSMFQYKNLPYKLTSQILEEALLFRNYLCFYKSQTIDEVVLCTYRYGGQYDLYWKPVKVDLFTLSGQPLATNVPYEDIVLIRDNTLDIIPFITMESWINKIIEMEKTLGILVKLIRFPTVLTGDKTEVAMLKQMLKKNIDCEGFVIGSKVSGNRLQQNDIKLPCDVDDMFNLIDKYKNLALGSIGVYGVEEKRERVVTEEITARNDMVDFVYTQRVEERKKAINECNKRWGLNIELLENYSINQIEEAELEATKTELITEAEDKGGSNDE